MNINYVLQTLDNVGHFGHLIGTEQSMVLYNSLLILQAENHFKNIFFWGKIYGTEHDYYIAYGYRTDILKGRVYYYSRDGIEWGLLPRPSRDGLLLAPLCTTQFQGDPAVVVNVLIEKDEPTIPGKRAGTETMQIKEEDRLAATVQLITDNAAIVPRGALFRSVDGVVGENQAFNGLSTLEAREISSFLHFRQPTKKYNTNLLTRDDYNYAMDFLDPLDIEIPKGCWPLQLTKDEEVVILRSLYWPGFMFFHQLRSAKHGFLYFGYGKKCIDPPFCLSPFKDI